MTDYNSVSDPHRSSQSHVFDPEFVSAIISVCNRISEAGYDPYSQLTGYLLTGNDAYITRSGNARAIIATLDRDQIQLYVKQHFK